MGSKNMTLKYTIYKITNLINNRFYIGMHRTKNINDYYLGSGKLIIQAIEKYGEENIVNLLITS